jgi:hypothetical protein
MSADRVKALSVLRGPVENYVTNGLRLLPPVSCIFANRRNQSQTHKYALTGANQEQTLLRNEGKQESRSYLL